MVTSSARRPPVRTAPGRSTTSRALSAFDGFDAGHTALTLSEIARRSDLPIATAHRLVAELCNARLLSRRSDGRYQVGARLWRLGLLAPPTVLREVALPHLQDLVIATGRTVHLAVLDGTRALVVERLVASRSQPTRHSPGNWLPLHCTAVGKVLLAHAPPDVLAQVLAALTPHTAFTMTDPRQLERQLSVIRKEGLARSAQEHRPGVSSLAMPVFGTTGVIASAAVLAPLTSPRLSEAIAPLAAAAASIGAAARSADFQLTADIDGETPSELGT